MNRDIKTTANGFTLIELLIAISISMIILTFAVPSFSSFIMNGRVTTYTNTLLSDVNYARHEAVTRGDKVILCRSANPTNNSPSCGGDTNNWSTGWLVFVDTDGNSSYDTGTDTLLRATAAAPGSVQIKTNGPSNENLVYKGDGIIDMAGGSAVFAVCDERGEFHGNQLQVSPTGRPRLISPVPNTCASPTV